MDISIGFLKQIIDTVNNNIAVTDRLFNIVFVNQAWVKFGVENGVSPQFSWIGESYFSPCLASTREGDEYGSLAVAGFRQLQCGELDHFQLEYPCHSPAEDRWFLVEVTRFVLSGETFFVISHMNITQRVKLEQDAFAQANKDGLTEIGNRKAFNDFMNAEVRRCHRYCTPMSVMILDVDNFKAINDSFGHQAGDDCLKGVARILSEYTERASDICARYGGDEFVVAWSYVCHDQAEELANKILQQVNQLGTQGKADKRYGPVSASIGMITTVPDCDNWQRLLSKADSLMYQAKHRGKNRVMAMGL
ncbi:sensor domain-containing diguanylate cyclase [Shewanella corallii]|uniref:diguanylate cyclase n=1 Tax=Shewanella corallii TaxID=560080 RepID=A0ABT0N6Y9_9GAMM|nr:diguanylate cyclase [Shewanella corallii]MCL2914198.1 sensor domain-containing diguanylate cyclase [Shewanella corallii]